MEVRKTITTLDVSLRVSSYHRNLGVIIGFTLFFFATTLLATEYITAKKSKGEVLVFRRGHVPVEEKSTVDKRSIQPVRSGTKEKSRVQDVSGLQRQTAIFHWEDVCYDIDIKGGTRRLLDNVDGWVEPGILTALMVSLYCNIPVVY